MLVAGEHSIGGAMTASDEQHRRECEARHVLKMSDDRRQEFYEGALKHRGREKVNQLIDDVNQLRRRERANESALQEG